MPASNSSTSTSSTDSARASLGLTHPAELTAASAGWWTTLHILLGSAVPASRSKPLDLLHGRPGTIAWAGRVAAFRTIAFYAVTDHITGYRVMAS